MIYARHLCRHIYTQWVLFAINALWPFLGDDDAKQLVLEAFGSDHEVQESDLRGQLGEVVRVAEFCGDVQSEVAGILDYGVSQLDAPYTTWNGGWEKGAIFFFSASYKFPIIMSVFAMLYT